MIATDKYNHALRALHDLFVQARFRACWLGDADLIRLLDVAEILPKYIAVDTDETETFRQSLRDVARLSGCAYIHEQFEETQPGDW